VLLKIYDKFLSMYVVYTVRDDIERKKTSLSREGPYRRKVNALERVERRSIRVHNLLVLL
jgi:hypothetical protein